MFYGIVENVPFKRSIFATLLFLNVTTSSVSEIFCKRFQSQLHFIRRKRFGATAAQKLTNKQLMPRYVMLTNFKVLCLPLCNFCFYETHLSRIQGKHSLCHGIVFEILIITRKSFFEKFTSIFRNVVHQKK